MNHRNTFLELPLSDIEPYRVPTLVDLCLKIVPGPKVADLSANGMPLVSDAYSKIIIGSQIEVRRRRIPCLQELSVAIKPLYQIFTYGNYQGTKLTAPNLKHIKLTRTFGVIEPHIEWHLLSVFQFSD